VVAEIELQRVANMANPSRTGDNSWLEFRAVCRDHGYDESGVIPNWMAHNTRERWIDAAMDALEHDLLVHPRRVRRDPGWEELISGPDTVEDSLIPRRRRRPLHALLVRPSVQG
jgi:hypothetical protein